MGKVCEICGKGPGFGKNVSHSHRKTPRQWKPNIQTAQVMIEGKLRKVNICTRCLKKVSTAS